MKNDNSNQDKSSVGGKHNSGVTSNDPKVKEKIEKQASMGKHQPPGHNDLTKDDIPDSTNESTGKMGSGLRQDSN